MLANRKLSSDHRFGKGQFSFQSQRRATPKAVHTIIKLVCSIRQDYAQNPSSLTSAVRKPELPDAQAGFQRSRRIRDQINNIHGKSKEV